MESIPAYFLTWTTYGVWLPGDARGWISKLNNAPGTDVCPPSLNYENLCKQRMEHPEVIFNIQQREIVKAAIESQCMFRGWHLFAINCRSNHLHILLQALEISPQKVMTTLKAYSTRELREQGFFLNHPVWTPHGSMRYLDQSENIHNVIRYINEQ